MGAGVACLVALPILGTKLEGGLGFGVGLLCGGAAAVVLPIEGLYKGAKQLLAGIKATPSAIHHARSCDADWNPYTRSWVRYQLSEQQPILRVSDEQFVAEWRQAQDWCVIGADGECCGEASVAQESAAAPVGIVEVYSTKSELRAELSAGLQVAETGLYELLGVTPDATDEQIRRAYWRLNLKTMHCLN